MTHDKKFEKILDSCLKVRLSQKILEDFPIAQKCAENYPGIKNPVNRIDKIFIVFNLLQF